MTMRRSPSAIGSGTGGTRSFPSSNTSEYRADGHTESGQITFAENVTRHDLAGRKNVGVWLRLLPQPLNLSPLIHLYTEIRKRDSRPQRVAIKRWRIDA